MLETTTAFPNTVTSYLSRTDQEYAMRGVTRPRTFRLLFPLCVEFKDVGEWNGGCRITSIIRLDPIEQRVNTKIIPQTRITLQLTNWAIEENYPAML